MFVLTDFDCAVIVMLVLLYFSIINFKERELSCAVQMRQGFALCFVAWNVGRERERKRFQTKAWTFNGVEGAFYIL